MARPNLFVLLPVAGCWWIFQKNLTLCVRLLGSGLALSGLFFGLLPSLLHNYRVSGEFTLVSTAGGVSFFIGNNPEASGKFHVPTSEKIDPSSHDAYRHSLKTLAERAAGRSLSPKEVSSYWFDRGKHYWVANPMAAMTLFGKKLLLSINSQESSIHHPYRAAATLFPILRLLIPFGILFPFAGMGVLLARKRSGVPLMAAGFWAYLLGMAAFYVADRYRMMLLPFLIPLAGIGMSELYLLYKKQGRKTAVLTTTLLLVLFSLTQVPLFSKANQKNAVCALYNLMGKAEGDRGRYEKAEFYFHKAILAAGPNQGTYARANLGLLHQMRGDFTSARRLYLKSARISQKNLEVRRKLARLAERTGDIPEAIKWWLEVVGLSADPARAKREIDRLSPLE
jgi:tetratricopeptide (TPR) repeat protein